MATPEKKIAASACFMLFAFVLAPAANAQGDKVGGEIVAHFIERIQAAERTTGTDADPPIVEERCALYCRRRLGPDEIEALAERGIVVAPDLWVPPVAGRHPFGFHLARVRHESLDVIRADPRFVRLESAEFMSEPHNDLGGALINVDDLHAGAPLFPRTGSGIAVAIADTGLDLSHGDFPAPAEAFDVTDGDAPGAWGTDVANTVTGHGTHVAATLLGRGTLSSGQYVGAAPAADLYFYKIGNDVTGGASAADEIEAIMRALSVGCRVFSISFGGTSVYMDGSSSVSQAIDAAVAGGMIVFASAGNEATTAKHDSIVLPPGASMSVNFSIVNDGGTTLTRTTDFRVIWIDGVPDDANIDLAIDNLGSGELFSQPFSSFSPRNTEGKRFRLIPNVQALSSKTYTLTLTNNATSGASPRVHIYRSSGVGTFTDPDPSYTVTHPSLADSAIAVAAWAHRREWVNYQGSTFAFNSLVEGERAPFSSIGPRIDGVRKPDIAAPGAATVSARDSVPGLDDTESLIVDNDAAALDGSGPADYYVRQGTSMACPMAAGVAALLIEANPDLTPAEVRFALLNTASLSGSPDAMLGFGLIDALAALQAIPIPPNSVRRWDRYDSSSYPRGILEDFAVNRESSH